MKLTTTVIIQNDWTVQPATGPNPDAKKFEVLDDDGDRYAYVDSNEEAAKLVKRLVASITEQPEADVSMEWENSYGIRTDANKAEK